MSDAPSRTGRPPQVTFGAGTVIAAGAIHVLSSFDDMRGLRTVDSKDRVHAIIESAANSGITLTQTEVLDLMHAGVLVSGAAAAAAVVMGIFALRGHRAAPPTLALVSVLVVLGSLLTDPFMGMLLAAGSAMLWTGPARDWFAGRPVRPSRVELAMAESRKSGAAGPGGSRVVSPPPPSPPAPEQPAVPRSGAHQEASPYPSVPPVYAPAHHRPARTSRRAPGAVRAAAVITLVTSGLIAGIYALLLMLLAIAREPILTELRKSPEIQRVDLGGADLIAVIAVASALLLVWSVSAIVLAVLAWRGHNWARILLLLSSVVMVLLCLLGLPVSLPLILVGAAVVVLLLTPQAREHFTRPDRVDAPLPAASSPGPWGSAPGSGPASSGPGGVPGPSPYGPPQPPPDGQLSPPHPGGHPQTPEAPHAPEAHQPQQAPPAAEDPTRDEDGKPPVW